MGEHAKYSASGSTRWLNCPGSIALSESAPPQAESKYATEGTEAHACLEFLLRNIRKSKSPQAVITKAEKTYGKEKTLHARAAIVEIFCRLDSSKANELLIETRVDASPFTCPDQFGTLDAAIVEEFGRLTVIDFKYGAGIVVNPAENSQMIYYALALSHQYDHAFSDVELVIIQPRAYTESGETTRSVVMSMQDLLAWAPKFKAGVKAAEDPTAPLRSGSWCQFCRAAPICPELKDRAFKQAQVAFSDTTGIESLPAPTGIQIPALGVILDACERLEDWIKSVREHAMHVLERGENIDGFKLVAKRSPRRWVDESETAKDAKRRFGDCVFSVPSLLSPAQLERSAKGSPNLDQWVAQHTTSESSGNVLVRSNDKRPAVNSIAAAFTVIEPEPVKNFIPAKVKIRRKKK